MSQEFRKLPLPPGVWRRGTEYQSHGHWYSANMVRFFQGEIRPIGGWTPFTINTTTTTETQVEIDGVVRGSVGWTDNNLQAFGAFGTAEGLFAYTLGAIEDITPTDFTEGLADAEFGTTGNGNYGDGPYGAGPYGGGGVAYAVLTPAMTWDLDIFGDWLVAVANGDGEAYVWDKTGIATTMVGAPEGNTGVVVTPENFVMLLGASGVGRRIQWATQGTTDEWAPGDPGSSAGAIDLVSEGIIVGARRSRGETLVWTTSELIGVRYSGGVYIYGTELLGRNCGPISKKSMMTFDAGAVWMGNGTFYFYDGYVKPLECTVSDFIFTDITQFQRSKIWCIHFADFGEIWWFYPSATSLECNRYVIWNYRENHWNVGGTDDVEFVRSSGFDRGAFSYPILSEPVRPVPGGNHSDLWYHENGQTRETNGQPCTAFLRSGPTEIGEGNTLCDIMQVIPDRRNFGGGDLRFLSRMTPEGPEREWGPFPMDEYTSVRIMGRQISVRYENDVNEDWRIGDFRFDVRPSGMKR